MVMLFHFTEKQIIEEFTIDTLAEIYRRLEEQSSSPKPGASRRPLSLEDLQHIGIRSGQLEKRLVSDRPVLSDSLNPPEFG